MKIYKITEAGEYIGVSINALKTLATRKELGKMVNNHMREVLKKL